MIVQASSGNKKYILPQHTQGSFIADKWFTARDKNRNLVLLHLESGHKTIFREIKDFTVSRNGSHFIALQKKTGNTSRLLIQDLEKQDTLYLPDVAGYVYHPATASLAFWTATGKGGELRVLHLKTLQQHLVFRSQEKKSFSGVTWQKNGKGLAFILSRGDDKGTDILGYYQFEPKKLYTFVPCSHPDFNPSLYIFSGRDTPLRVSDDGKRVFFGLHPKTKVADPGLAEVWYTDDKSLYPIKKLVQNWNNIAKVGYWEPQTGKYKQITDNQSPKMMLAGQQDIVLLYDPVFYEPQSEYYAPRDIYLMDLSTGKQKLLLEKHPTFPGSFNLSPDGMYVIYFKNKHWWVYDIGQQQHYNLTRDLGVPFGRDSRNDNHPAPYGYPYWVEEDRALYLCDQYDLWKIPVDGSPAKRITHGREQQTTYRLITKPINPGNTPNYDGTTMGSYNKTQPLYFALQQGDTRGYAYWESGTRPKSIVMVKAWLHGAKVAKNGKALSYLFERFDAPPQLRYYRSTDHKPIQKLFQSNPQHNKYAWGASEKIHYVNSQGEKLSGVLCYPAGYRQDKTYPMIVHVYENQSDQLYQYKRPSVFNSTGFNLTHLTSNGYFVFLPDIHYQIGNPGFSAADCIIAGTQAAIKAASIDSSRVGLIGHSFGGYETLFTITQTNMFAAAVSGAGIASYIKGYLHIADKEKANYFQYEHSQLRMGKPLFDNFTGYLKNSPLYHARNITTPLLSWTGKEDFHVAYDQSVALYMALRRLGKNNTMLLYPEEAHVLIKPSNQKDLTLRIRAWFDHYLKGKKKPEWMQ
ncbi:S9 family peptidase [Sinomicrobium oceani]|uniref:S9 family peptidase n=1 Tax=Sinomicrobium oceani TaxID=1150368 RepID=UPI00227D287D|nr:prolyl oligopeptidase family serine peptidase [Sinomicrobium oceani]